MDVALTLARRGVGDTSTNPSVGCVIVKDGRALGRGRTGKDGRPHAERLALTDAQTRWGSDAVRGATAYVTLEPCAHTGKTPPCSVALIEAGIARVVAPLSDPDSRVSGKGFAALQEAGITVDIGLRAKTAETVLRGYLSRANRRRPYLTLKLASTLDGQIATRTGESRWITGPKARARVHLLRSKSDGILVGVGSVMADDPALDVRLPGLEQRRPARIVADSRLQTPLTGRLARTAGEQPLILLTSHDVETPRVNAFEALGAQVIQVASLPSKYLSMSDALDRLAEAGIGTLFCEGGGRLAASLIREALVDELIWFTAGATIGRGGAASVSDFGLETIAEMPRFAQVALERLGDDVMSVWQAQDT
ncbi:UNVERIFIED_CONTAM: hypothetical protein GTU68_020374 [Idotea baltica]|nr:hypothetical protein [Idotea baltica]